MEPAYAVAFWFLGLILLLIVLLHSLLEGWPEAPDDARHRVREDFNPGRHGAARRTRQLLGAAVTGMRDASAAMLPVATRLAVRPIRWAFGGRGGNRAR